jgi:hypothetical protein
LISIFVYKVIFPGGSWRFCIDSFLEVIGSRGGHKTTKPNPKRPKPRRPIRKMGSKFCRPNLFSQFGPLFVVTEWTELTEFYAIGA